MPIAGDLKKIAGHIYFTSHESAETGSYDTKIFLFLILTPQLKPLA